MMLKRNEGVIDRMVRVVLGIGLVPVGLFALGALQGSVLGLVTASLGGWVLITGLIGVCPLYYPLGISTVEKKRHPLARCTAMMADCFRGNTSASHMYGPCASSVEKPDHQPV